MRCWVSCALSRHWSVLRVRTEVVGDKGMNRKSESRRQTNGCGVLHQRNIVKHPDNYASCVKSGRSVSRATSDGMLARARGAGHMSIRPLSTSLMAHREVQTPAWAKAQRTLSASIRALEAAGSKVFGLVGNAWSETTLSSELLCPWCVKLASPP